MERPKKCFWKKKDLLLTDSKNKNFGTCMHTVSLFRNKKKEDGSMLLDEMGSLLVMLFIFMMIIAYACYAKAIQMRLAVDNIAKEYLYVMEAEGKLTENARKEMKKELVSLGIHESSINFTGTTYTTNQAPYGTQMKLVCSMEFDNPLFGALDASSHGNVLFTVSGLNPTIKYTVNMTATSKW